MIPGMRYVLLCFAIFLASVPSFAGTHKADSLGLLLKNSAEDSNKVKNLDALALELVDMDPDTAILLAGQALAIAEKLNNNLLVAQSLHIIAGAHIDKGNYPEALALERKALKVLDKTRYKEQLSKSLGNVGIIYKEQGDYSRALEYYFKTLKIAEELKDIAVRKGNVPGINSGNKGILIALSNIGVVYKTLGNYDKALEYLFRAQQLAFEFGNKNFTAAILGNIGNVYDRKGDHAKALEYYLKTLREFEALGSRNGIATVMGNIAMSYEDLGDLGRADEWFGKALKIDEEFGNKNNLARHYGDRGELKVKQKKLKEAGELLRRSIDLAREFKGRELIRDDLYNLVKLDTLLGDFNLALEHYKNYIAYGDSLQNEETTKKQTRLEMQYEFDKKQAADSTRNSEIMKQEDLKHRQEIQQQQIYTLGGAAGFVLMLLIAGISFRAYRQKRRSNEIITRQKHLVEEKQKEVLDSIQYARRIQNSLLPSEKYIAKKLDALRK